MNGIEYLGQLLVREGYEKKESNFPWCTLYLKTQEGEQTRGIILYVCKEDRTEDLNMLKEIYGRTYHMMAQIHYNPALLMLITGNQMYRYKEVTEVIPACWLWDQLQKRVYIYENQPSDFLGLKQKIESIPQETQVTKRKRAVMNMAIIGINCLVFLLMECIGSTSDVEFMAYHGAMYAPWVHNYKEYYRLLTCMFLHFGISHLGNNMLVLFFLGDNVERAVGKWKYIVIYLMSGLGGSFLSYVHMMLTGKYAVSAGASGAIFGIIGSLLYMVAVNKGKLEDLTTKKLGILLAISLYHGFTSSGVDNYAHIGGLICGFFVTMALYKKRKYP